MASKMFPFIDDTWNPLGGACRHNCYGGGCWAQRMASEKAMAKYQGEPRLYQVELEREFAPGAFIFACSMVDLLGSWVGKVEILAVLDVIRNTPKTDFLLLTKNPKRYLEFVDVLPMNAVLGCTVESDMYLQSGISNAPSPLSRLDAMTMLADMVGNRLFYSVEPIMEFGHPFFAQALTRRRRELFGVAVGYDNYGNHLPEPSLAKTMQLIELLEKAGVKVFRKSLREAWNV